MTNQDAAVSRILAGWPADGEPSAEQIVRWVHEEARWWPTPEGKYRILDGHGHQLSWVQTKADAAWNEAAQHRTVQSALAAAAEKGWKDVLMKYPKAYEDYDMVDGEQQFRVRSGIYPNKVLGLGGSKGTAKLFAYARLRGEKESESAQGEAKHECGSNYVANRKQRPTEVRFENGRRVWIAQDEQGPYLEVAMMQPGEAWLRNAADAEDVGFDELITTLRASLAESERARAEMEERLRA